jgi:NAD(P)-dependent dehydrogenase (short-subunit alcohol dehydrogenase family)
LRLANKVALITGAASGIGKASMERFLKEGAKVVAIDINPEGKSLVDKWVSEGYHVKFYQQDVGELDKLPDLVDFTVDCFGSLDILVNNAGVESPQNVFEITQNDWERIHRINLESVFFLSQAAAKVMKKQNYGRIVNLSSLQGYRASHSSSHYNASKGGIIQITRCFALELADYNIMVNSVAPGVIHTAMSVVDGIDETETELFKEIYVKQGKIPLRRAGKPEEVASTILFLSSDECEYMTGQIIGVDGGLSIVW